MADEEKTRQTQIEAEKGWLRLPVYHSLYCTVGGDEPCTCFVGAFRARLNALEAQVALLAGQLDEARTLLNVGAIAAEEMLAMHRGEENELAPWAPESWQAWVIDASEAVRARERANGES